MKIIKGLIFTALAATCTNGFAQKPASPADTKAQQTFQAAQIGCQKVIGYFPTPAKLLCLMTALGISQNDAKPKALALIFNVCHGRMTHQAPGAAPAKIYNTLGECLSDPAAIANINTEMKAQGLPEVKVVNSAVLGTQAAAPTTPPEPGPAQAPAPTQAPAPQATPGPVPSPTITPTTTEPNINPSAPNPSPANSMPQQ